MISKLDNSSIYIKDPNLLKYSATPESVVLFSKNISEKEKRIEKWMPEKKYARIYLEVMTLLGLKEYDKETVNPKFVSEITENM